MSPREGDIVRTIGEHYAHFLHYRTAGNPGCHGLDDTQGLNDPPILRAIAQTGYVGYEFIPKGDLIAALKSAFVLCNG